MKTNLLMSLGGCLASTLGVLVTTMEAQQGQPGSAPGGTPSQQPRPANPTPRPASPAQPGNNQPGTDQPGNNQPAQPAQPTPVERRPERTPLTRQPGVSGDSPRFFAFTDPTMEPRFRESTSRLSGLERAMAERNQRLIQRLGAVRQLPAERQNAAVMDLLQDILQENAQLHQYLMQSRTLFTGDFPDPNAPPTSPGTNQPDLNPPAQPNSPPASPTTANPPR